MSSQWLVEKAMCYAPVKRLAGMIVSTFVELDFKYYSRCV